MERGLPAHRCSFQWAARILPHLDQMRRPYACDLRVKKVDGQLKIDRECWIRVPANYQTDYPERLGEEGLPCWPFVDYGKPY